MPWALNQADFNRLVEDHGPALYRMAYRMIGDQHEAEDMVQEAFRSVWKSRRGTTPSAEIAPGWWPSSAAGLSTAGGSTRRRAYWPRTMPRTSGFRPRPFGDEYTDEVQAALDLLPPELRETLLLVVVGELTHQEAADLLGIPLGTVLSRVSRHGCGCGNTWAPT